MPPLKYVELLALAQQRIAQQLAAYNYVNGPYRGHSRWAGKRLAVILVREKSKNKISEMLKKHILMNIPQVILQYTCRVTYHLQHYSTT